MKITFPNDFHWGSATAALQVEGATDIDGRGASVWDEFCARNPAKIFQAATPERACEHYYRWEEDVEWMATLGHTSYRFSISWPRLFPDGKGALNSRGVDFYSRLIDRLLQHGIEPNVTLYHWDIPLPLAQQGGWENSETVSAFLEYADTCYRLLGDRVKLWSTINEPAWTTLNGYLTGLHPPGKTDRKAALLAAHHLLVAHHEACAITPSGIALNLSPVYPATSSQADTEAARRADLILNEWFLEAVIRGSYPNELVQLYDKLGLMPESPWPLRRTEPSFLGINYYYPHHARAGAAGTTFHINNTGNPQEDCKFSLEGCFELVKNPKGRYTDWAWEIDPETLTTLLQRVARQAPGIDLYVTENGIGLPDRLENGEVDDQPRIDFVSQHLVAIHQAMENGAPVKGYYMWSLMDNFSWINGYKKRYGFLYIDRETMKRTPKKSAHWFADIARSGCLNSP